MECRLPGFCDANNRESCVYLGGQWQCCTVSLEDYVPGCTWVYLDVLRFTWVYSGQYWTLVQFFVGGWDDANKKITVNILVGHYWPSGREVSKDLWIGYFTPPGEKISWGGRNMKMQNYPKDGNQLFTTVTLSSLFPRLVLTFCNIFLPSREVGAH